jgi:hypothetical protein
VAQKAKRFRPRPQAAKINPNQFKNGKVAKTVSDRTSLAIFCRCKSLGKWQKPRRPARFLFEDGGRYRVLRERMLDL